MSADEIAAFIEERAAVEDGIEHEADYVGARGKGPYLRALARELREKFNTRSQTSTIPDITKRDEGADAYEDILDYIDEAPDAWTAEMIVDGVAARCERLKDDRGARPAHGELTFTAEEHARLLALAPKMRRVRCCKCSTDYPLDLPSGDVRTSCRSGCGHFFSSQCCEYYSLGAGDSLDTHNGEKK